MKEFSQRKQNKYICTHIKDTCFSFALLLFVVYLPYRNWEMRTCWIFDYIHSLRCLKH